MNELTRADAIAYLMLKPEGSLSDWARAWGWSRSKVERFLHSLERAGAVTVERSKAGTRVSGCLGVSRPEKETTETLNPQSGAVSVSVSRYLDILGTRYLDTAEAETPNSNDVSPAQLIEALNAGLLVALGSQFRPISADNRGSLRAAARILSRVPADRALELVELAGRAFNPSSSGGSLPRSLGHPFFTRYVFNESKRIERALEKEQLELLPQLDMHVEKNTTDSGTVSRPTVAPAVANPEEPASTPFSAGMSIARAAFEAAGGARE